MNERDDEFMDELMMDVWDGLKEEPCSKKNYPAKKKKKLENKEVKAKKRFRIHYRFDGLDVSEIQEAYSADQAVTVFCKLSDSWYIKKEIARKTRGFWVEEIKEEKVMDMALTKQQWDLLSYMTDDCYGNHDYPGKSGMVTYIMTNKNAKMRFEQFKSGTYLSIIDKNNDIHASYKLNDDAIALLFNNIFSQIGGIWFRREMPNPFRDYIIMAKTCLIAAGIIDGNMFNEENKKEEQEMKEDKEMNLDDVVNAANAQAEQAEAVENAVEEAQRENAEEIVEKVEENVKEEIVMAEENKKVNEQVIEAQEKQPIVIENAVPVASIVLETIAGNNKELSVALMPQDEKKGLLQAIRVTDGEFEDIGSYVLGGGYAFPLFRISSKWFKKVTLSVNRKVDTMNRTIAFSGSKNYMSLLKLMFSDEEIEQAKATEIARRFPPIRERSESKGVEKNLSVTVALDGEAITLTGWVQREWRPLYLENGDRTITVRWDFAKKYPDPSIKFRNRMLRKNHDGVSGNPEDVKIFEAIKTTILTELNKG